MDEQQRKLAEELLFSTKKPLSFAKQFYFGRFDSEHIFPFPEAEAAEQKRVEDFLSTLSTFIATEIDGDAIDRQQEIPTRVIEGLGRLGVLGMTIPVEYGGLGMSQYAYCRAVELLAKKCASTALFVNAHQSVGLKALLLFGTHDQKARWLPPLARGEILGAFSLTEKNAGSDAAAVETRATYNPTNNSWSINGRKQWTTNGGIAGVLTVMARTEIDTPTGKQDKITAFLVTPDMQGFEVLNPALEKVGMRGTKTANLAFNHVEVPAANILGPLGGGLKVALTVLDYGRTTFGATCTGSAKFALEQSIDHARHRYQFKQPLGAFPLIKMKIAKMQALTYAMESTTLLTASFVDRDVEDFMLESAMLKVFCSEALWDIIYETMQIYGGKSFFTDAPFERMMRDARLNMIGEGANEVMRVFIGIVGLRDVGMELKAMLESIQSPIKKFSALRASIKECLAKITIPLIAVKSERMQIHALGLGRRIRAFGLSIPKLLISHREKVVDKQLLLNRIATCAMALYTAAAVLSRIDTGVWQREKGYISGDFEEFDIEIATAELYFQMAFETIDSALQGLKENFDTQMETLADKITGIPQR